MQADSLNVRNLAVVVEGQRGFAAQVDGREYRLIVAKSILKHRRVSEKAAVYQQADGCRAASSQRQAGRHVDLKRACRLKSPSSRLRSIVAIQAVQSLAVELL